MTTREHNQRRRLGDTFLIDDIFVRLNGRRMINGGVCSRSQRIFTTIWAHCCYFRKLFQGVAHDLDRDKGNYDR